MELIKRNKWLVCFSQIGAWAFLLLLIFTRPLHILLPAANNVPAAFTVSIWLIESLIIMNIIVYILNRRWLRRNSGSYSDISIQCKYIAKLHLLVSSLHVLIVCISIILLFGGEDL